MLALGSVELCFLRSFFARLSNVRFLFRELAIKRRVDEIPVLLSVGARSVSSCIVVSSMRHEGNFGQLGPLLDFED